MADVSIKSVDLLRQYLGKFREFADAVDIGVLAYKRNLERRKDKLQTYKADIDDKTSGCIQKLAYRISQLESYMEKYRDMCPRDLALFKEELEDNKDIKHKLESKVNELKGKIDDEIGIIDNIWNLTYSYGNKTRTMAETGNGVIERTIANIEKYENI